MDGFADILDKVKALQAFNTHNEVVQIVVENKKRITDLQQQQLAEGVGKDGQPRSDEYRPLTKYLKRTLPGLSSLGRVTDRVTFFMQGQLYNSMYTQINGEEFIVVSGLPTYDKMLDRIGSINYGLDPDQCAEMANDIVLPEFKNVFKAKTGFVL